MDRREVLRYTALMTGAAVSLPLASVLLSGCNTEAAATASDYAPQFFSEDEFSFLIEIVDNILPATDSPSASDVGVHQVIDHMIAKVYALEDRENVKAGFTALRDHLEPRREQMTAAMTAIDNSDGQEEKPLRDAFRTLKQQTVAFYLSTEEVATKYLNYEPVPGEYEGCVDLSDLNGRAWVL